jgi:hypothetical protein
MLEGTLLPAAQRKDNAMAALRAAGFGWQEVPKLRGRQGRVRTDREVDADAVSFKDA